LWPYFVDAVTARSCGGTWWATLLFVSNYFTSNSQVLHDRGTSILQFVNCTILVHHSSLVLVCRHPTSHTGPTLSIQHREVPKTSGQSNHLHLYGFDVLQLRSDSGQKLGVRNDAWVPHLYKTFPHFIRSSRFSTDSVEYLHFSTLARLPSWLVGVVFGYFIYHSSCNNTKIPNRINNILWTISLSTMMVLVLSTTIFLRKYHTLLFSAIFNAFARPLWATAVCFIVFSCTKGCGGDLDVCKISNNFEKFQDWSTSFCRTLYSRFWTDSRTACT
jgi:hypothetical protein